MTSLKEKISSHTAAAGPSSATRKIAEYIAAQNEILDEREAAFHALSGRVPELEAQIMAYAINPDAKGLSKAAALETELAASTALLARLPRPEHRPHALGVLLDGGVTDPGVFRDADEGIMERFHEAQRESTRRAAAIGAPLLRALAIERAAHLKEIRVGLVSQRVTAASMEDDDLAISRALATATAQLTRLETELNAISRGITIWEGGERGTPPVFGFQAFHARLNAVAMTLPTLPVKAAMAMAGV